ncbi:hypothetical protein AAHA92_15777 [Salvia divinorum]|uniref:Uncharacterized protein n=1 Tax=Salvia divinorum TaxID=28513 RepID=A0ABD1HH66_SALDI
MQGHSSRCSDAAADRVGCGSPPLPHSRAAVRSPPLSRRLSSPTSGRPSSRVASYRPQFNSIKLYKFHTPQPLSSVSLSTLTTLDSHVADSIDRARHPKGIVVDFELHSVPHSLYCTFILGFWTR